MNNLCIRGCFAASYLITKNYQFQYIKNRKNLITNKIRQKSCFYLTKILIPGILPVNSLFLCVTILHNICPRILGEYFPPSFLSLIFSQRKTSFHHRFPQTLLVTNFPIENFLITGNYC